MKRTQLLLVSLSLALVLSACAWFQKKAGDRIASFFGNGAAGYFECAEPPKVVKWFQEKCNSLGLCSDVTGPISGAILKPLVDKLVPAGVDWAIPDAWGTCKATKPKDGLKSFLYGLIDKLVVKFEE